MNDEINFEFMSLALALAKKGQGKARPNPCVGAILVKNKKIVGRGFHKTTGREHAEIIAIITPQIILTNINKRILGYLSTRVPAYKPQNKVKNVIIRYASVNKSDRLTISTKYQGIAIMLIPCATPEIILAKNNSLIAYLFLIKYKLLNEYIFLWEYDSFHQQKCLEKWLAHDQKYFVYPSQILS